MLKSLSPALPYRIEECPNLMADAVLCDEQNTLVFASLWGGNTAVQEFLARLTLGATQDGLECFHIEFEERMHPVYVHNVDAYDKEATREYQGTMFGSMVHLFLFDKRCVRPDKASTRAMAIFPKDSADRTPWLWALVQETSPLPLLDHWRDAVLDILRAQQMLTVLPVSIGLLEGHRLELDVPVLTQALSALIQDGTLGVSPPARTTRPRLGRVA